MVVRPHRTQLSGLNEVPAILTPARGSFEVRVTDGGTALDYRLSYSGFAPISMAHIHIGQPGVNGGIAVFCAVADRRRLAPRRQAR